MRTVGHGASVVQHPHNDHAGCSTSFKVKIDTAVTKIMYKVTSTSGGYSTATCCGNPLPPEQQRVQDVEGELASPSSIMGRLERR